MCVCEREREREARYGLREKLETQGFNNEAQTKRERLEEDRRTGKQTDTKR